MENREKSVNLLKRILRSPVGKAVLPLIAIGGVTGSACAINNNRPVTETAQSASTPTIEPTKAHLPPLMAVPAASYLPISFPTSFLGLKRCLD